LADYFEAREQRGSKGLAKDRAAAQTRILPLLGDVELPKLTTARIRQWQTGLATAPKLTRAPRLAKARKSNAVDMSDADAVRARRATANRTLTVLKAALNHAFHEGHVASDDPWRKVKPYKEVDAAVVRFLRPQEAARIIAACSPDFANIVHAALQTGARYGELTRMQAGDFNAEAGAITVQISKSGKPRRIALNDEGVTLFASLSANLASNELIFRREDGKAWGASHQQRPLEEASKRAGIEPPATFHILRHSYASALAMEGVPMGVIAAQLGHSDTRMTEKHYAHLSPSYVADTVRKALPSFKVSV
jgi:integrase